MKSLPSTKASAMATGGITEAATVGIENWFKIGQLPLSSSVREDRLSYSSASDMMAVKHKTAKYAMKAAAPAQLAVVAVSTKSLKLFGTVHSILLAVPFS
jgi:hypothetical protein